MEFDYEIQKSGPPQKVQAIEVSILLSLILPSMIMSASLSKGNITFSMVAWSTVLSDIPLLALVIYFVWHNGEPLYAIGIRLQNWWKEAGIGVLIFIPIMYLIGAIQMLLKKAGLSVPHEAPSFLVPSGGGEFILAIVFLIVVAVSEEVIFRGYLIRRFFVITKNPGVALVLSSAIFALGHGYERSGGMIGAGILGFAFGAVYLWRKNLAAPVVMHFIQNFIGIILVPLIGEFHMS
ncbi:MAG: CPBP family intramembrane metalloprotease [Syntrophales bacterium]|jgi:membrane protease YdiL (CAAX protease family)|nr:CPBP family intramembrane metalloprotease [Syntrophales bacterium]MDY0044653.1 type II CAAX endopeptidase family protein [Syntrophales bacterium]